MPPETVTGPTKSVLDGPPPLPARPRRFIRPERVIRMGRPPTPPAFGPEKRPVRVTVLAGHGRGRDTARRPVRARSLLGVRVPTAVVAPAGRPHIRARVRVTTKAVGATPRFVVRPRLLLQKLGGPETKVVSPVAAIESPPRGRAGPKAGRVTRRLRVIAPAIGETPRVAGSAPRGGRPPGVAPTNTKETIIFAAPFAPPYSLIA